ncbi:YtfJ family protein [Otariodibacter sp.]|uniref:YtfJ family protein n=1 Tax=Otariodibacter sp. TaxID=3030919 RepID=UPI00260D47ED|nr:YtfJ family protein [Otariodibacter sp.]
MKKNYLFFAVVGLFSSSIFAHNITLNHSLPTVSVQNDGEIVMKGNKIAYQPWSSTKLAGKVRVIQHIAGRSSAKEKNEGLIEAIRKANFDRAKYQTTTIVNADDAIIATGSFVKSSAEDGKRKNSHSQVILDQASNVKDKWQLKAKDSAIIVLDKNSKVQFVSEGKLSPSQINQIITLVNHLITEG